MKKSKYIIYVIIYIFLFGCDNSVNKSTSKPKTERYALRDLIDSCMQSQPNVMNNDVTKSIFADTLKECFQRFRGSTLPYLKNLPLQYEMCLEYPRIFESELDKNAGKYVVKFAFGEISSKCRLSDKYETTFQVFAILDKETVATLVDNSLYYIEGTFRDFANNSQETGFLLPSRRYFIDYPRISTSWCNEPFIDLGTLIIDSLSFSQITQ